MTFRIVAGAALGLALSTSAFAQSYNAPAGIPAATAPGGLVGSAAPGNAYHYDQRFVPVEGVYATGSVRGYRGERVR